MKRLLAFFLLLSPPLLSGEETKTIFNPFSGRLDYITKLSSNTLPSGSTQYIQNRDTLQSGATFYVSSGTVQGPFQVEKGSITINSRNEANAPSEKIHLFGSAPRIAFQQGAAGNRYYHTGVPTSDDGTFRIGRSDHSNAVKFLVETTDITLSPVTTASGMSFQLATNGVYNWGSSSTSGNSDFRFGKRSSDNATNDGAFYNVYGGTWTFNSGGPLERTVILKADSAQAVPLLESQSSDGTVFAVIDSTGTSGLKSYTSDQFKTVTISRVGLEAYCSNCTNAYVCVSTGTSAGQWANIAAPKSAATPCN